MIFYLFQLGYDLDLRRTATKIFFHFLESSRVIAAHSNEFNFHIFYKLVLGAPKNIKHTIYLDESKSFYVSIKRHLTLNIVLTEYIFKKYSDFFIVSTAYRNVQTIVLHHRRL